VTQRLPAGEQLELLDELSIAYNASEAMSVYDAQQLFNACERVNGVSLSTATQLFFSFKIPLDEFISGDGDVAYTTLQFLIGQRKDAAEAEEEATPAESPPPPPPARAAAPKASSAPPNGSVHGSQRTVPPRLRLFFRRAAAGRR
jgi:hypothetical protein